MAFLNFNIVPILIVLTMMVKWLSCASGKFPDYDDHPCRRKCEAHRTMHCHYDFKVEWYYTLSKKACKNCPFEAANCFLPQCIAADGFSKTVLTVNRMIPGPALQVCEGDRVSVTLSNHLDNGEGTSIHWHGLHQRKHPYMDGVSMITQCPIQPFTSFVYSFPATPAGTHLWHSHTGLQFGDGMFGAFVIREANDPHKDLYDFDVYEHVIVVNDWMQGSIVHQFTKNTYFSSSNNAQSILINGRGATYEVKNPNDNTKKAFTPYSEFSVNPGKRYRFRVIGVGIVNCPIQISIAGHRLLMIATDGKPVEPLGTDSFLVFSGERYDFVIETNQTIGNYWIRAAGIECNDYGISQAAILHYREAPRQNPTGPTNYDSMLSSSGMVVNPLNKPKSKTNKPIASLRSLPEKVKDSWLRKVPDLKFYLGIGFHNVPDTNGYDPEDILPAPQINNITSHFASSPLLSQPESLDQSLVCTEENTVDCDVKYCTCIHRKHIPLGSVVELIIVGEGEGFKVSHPVHLHGYSFRVLGQTTLSYNVDSLTVKRMDEEGEVERNFVNPPWKDTVMVPDKGWTVVRFLADNPGEWFFHCHILFHSEAGMVMSFRVGELKDVEPLPRNFPLCGNFLGDLRDTSSGVRQGHHYYYGVKSAPTITVVVVLLMLTHYFE